VGLPLCTVAGVGAQRTGGTARGWRAGILFIERRLGDVHGSPREAYWRRLADRGVLDSGRILVGLEFASGSARRTPSPARRSKCGAIYGRGQNGGSGAGCVVLRSNSIRWHRNNPQIQPLRMRALQPGKGRSDRKKLFCRGRALRLRAKVLRTLYTGAGSKTECRSRFLQHAPERRQ
jgi:hypothetical protein